MSNELVRKHDHNQTNKIPHLNPQFKQSRAKTSAGIRIKFRYIERGRGIGAWPDHDRGPEPQGRQAGLQKGPARVSLAAPLLPPSPVRWYSPAARVDASGRVLFSPPFSPASLPTSRPAARARRSHWGFRCTARKMDLEMVVGGLWKHHGLCLYLGWASRGHMGCLVSSFPKV